jgi:hypothetical protein
VPDIFGGQEINLFSLAAGLAVATLIVRLSASAR